MATKSTNGKIWTVAIVAILAFLVYKLWPSLKKLLSGASSGSGSGGGATGAGYYANPYQYPSNQGQSPSMSFGASSSLGKNSSRSSNPDALAFTPSPADIAAASPSVLSPDAYAAAANSQVAPGGVVGPENSSLINGVFVKDSDVSANPDFYGMGTPDIADTTSMGAFSSFINSLFSNSDNGQPDATILGTPQTSLTDMLLYQADTDYQLANGGVDDALSSNVSSDDPDYAAAGDAGGDVGDMSGAFSGGDGGGSAPTYNPSS
jgi:hypothetical protein